MAVDKTAALLATFILYGAGHLLFIITKRVIEATADVVFGTFKRLGADEERRRIEEEQEEEELKILQKEQKCSDFEPPPVQVNGKKAD